jgi:hypothetical protein
MASGGSLGTPESSFTHSGAGASSTGGNGGLARIDFSKPVSGELLERAYDELTLAQRLSQYRLGLGVTAVIIFAVGVVDLYRALGTLSSSGCAPYCMPHARLPLVLVEMGACASCLLALSLTLHSGLVALALRGIVIAYILVGGAIAVASAAFDEAFALRISTSLMLLFYAILGNVSGMRFVRVLLVCLLTALAYALRIAAAFGAFGDGHRSLWHLLVDAHGPAASLSSPATSVREMLPASATFGGADSINTLFWVFAAMIGSLSASYSKEAYERRRFVLVQRLKDETQKTDAFLYRMLPHTVVAQIKQGFHVADEFDEVFILASDICGFTKLSAASKPSEVMQLLSELFSKFDQLSEAMGVYKVQTIGDAYIAVTGIF